MSTLENRKNSGSERSSDPGSAILAFVGMPGSGKSEASSLAQEMGLQVVVMGDVVREEVRARGLDPTDSNHGLVACSLRREEGPEAIARRCIGKMHFPGLVVVDGVRSLEEVSFFRSYCSQFILVEVYSDPYLRLRRLASRGRSDDLPSGSARFGLDQSPGQSPEVANSGIGDVRLFSPCDPSLRETASALERREIRELGWGMAQALKGADVRIANNGTLEELRCAIRYLLEGIQDKLEAVG